MVRYIRASSDGKLSSSYAEKGEDDCVHCRPSFNNLACTDGERAGLLRFPTNYCIPRPTGMAPKSTSGCRLWLRQAFRNWSIIDAWRPGFYLLMAYVWVGDRHGPFVDPWEGVFAYEQGAWATALAPRTEEGSEAVRWVGFAAALLSIRWDAPTVIFAALYVQHLFAAVTNFANHPYLFVLLSILTSAAACDRKHAEAWYGALRGQVIIVYAFASLWKITPTWLDGTIVRGIFTSFEEQGVARGIPWKSIDYPEVWYVIAFGGFALDATLFLVLWLGPPGHWLQWTCLIFHGFTSFTMSQRIGYSFPLAMILSTVLFVGNKSNGFGVSSLSSRKKYSAPLSRWLLVRFWIALQVLIPLRMPFVSRNEYHYTAEGYRFSWTMMLHSKAVVMSPNQYTGNLRPTCNNAPWPTDERVPYENLIGLRGMAALSMFPRILPNLAHSVSDLLSKSCPGELGLYADWFASVDDGSYVRMVDPTINLLDVYSAQRNRTWMQAAIGIAMDKPKIEYLLYNVSSSEKVEEHVATVERSEQPTNNNEWRPKGKLFIDRSRCLSHAPIRFYKVEWMRLEVLLSDDIAQMWYRVGRGQPQLLQKKTPVFIEYANSVMIGVVHPISKSSVHRKQNSWPDQTDPEHSCAGSPIDTVIDVQMIKPVAPVVEKAVKSPSAGRKKMKKRKAKKKRRNGIPQAKGVTDTLPQQRRKKKRRRRRNGRHKPRQEL